MKYDISPVPKPRMTQRDKWEKRPCVMRYRAFKDECRLCGVRVPEGGARVRFSIPMPKSWSKKKKSEMAGLPHQVRPDVDNLLKALLDAVYGDDSVVWDIRVTKIWGYHGRIEITKKV